MHRIISSLWFIIVSLSSFVMYIIAVFIKLFTFLFDKRLRALHMFTSFWASIYTWMMPSWRIKIFDKHKIRKKTTYMVVSNHQSLLDILVCFRIFFHYKFVSKLEIFKIPFIGWNMSLNRYIKLVRGDKESIDQMMEDSEKALASGSSVFFYPEGTRSTNGQIRDFKPGAFLLAKKMKIPILPIVISGSNEALPKYSFDYHGIHKIWLRVLDEVPYEDFADLSVEEFSDMVRQKMITALDKLNIERSGKQGGEE
ncbi:MAG: 1-acyl-sn-glycerol-3-phosphate acyltransferase [bacterium]|nr:1-acyl-sn-glycerol-3-phosphate acyltransferase [bacterium]